MMQKDIVYAGFVKHSPCAAKVVSIETGVQEKQVSAWCNWFENRGLLRREGRRPIIWYVKQP